MSNKGLNKNEINISNIKKIRNEILLIMKSLEEKEQKLIDINNENINSIETYKFFIQEIITEYHGVCKKIYN